MSQKPENFRSPYLSHRDRIPFALKRILMPDTDFTFVYSGIWNTALMTANRFR